MKIGAHLSGKNWARNKAKYFAHKLKMSQWGGFGRIKWLTPYLALLLVQPPFLTLLGPC